MPDELSPEEKLLRLIRGGTEPSSSGEPQPVPTDPATGTQNQPEETGKNTAEPALIEEGQHPAEQQNSTKRIKKTRANKTRESAAIQKSDNPPEPENEAPKVPPAPIKIEMSSAVPATPATSEDREESKSILTKISPAVSDDSSQEKEDSPEKNILSSETKTENSSAIEKKVHPMFSFFDWISSGFTLWNRLLLLTALLFLGISVWYVIGLPKLMMEAPLIPTGSESKKESDNEAQLTAFAKPKPFPYFAEEIGKKNLFRVVEPPPPPKPKAEKVEPTKPKIKIETLTRNFVLQGIVYDIGPPQAIIFDKKENKTLFLGNGDTIGQVKIKEIQRGKIILEYEDQTQEITF